MKSECILLPMKMRKKKKNRRREEECCWNIAEAEKEEEKEVLLDLEYYWIINPGNNVPHPQFMYSGILLNFL